MYAIYLIQPCSWFALHKQLKKVDRTWGANYYTDRIEYLVSIGYIKRDSNRLYSLTDTGLSLLKDIENRLRKERHDK
jgi:hypothetical protein